MEIVHGLYTTEDEYTEIIGRIVTEFIYNFYPFIVVLEISRFAAFLIWICLMFDNISNRCSFRHLSTVKSIRGFSAT
jgi:hypothetical protein